MRRSVQSIYSRQVKPILHQWFDNKESSVQRGLLKTTVPSHEVILLASIFVPHCNVHKASLLVIEVEVKLLSPLGVQCFGNCLK